MVTEIGEYKGNKMIIIKKDENDQYPVQFGKEKAKKIVENFEAVKAFAESED